ncbi:MAG: MSCRAMM family adhesin SdrC, partial [Lachnospiraceae bacterium]|nr:MSCRAMM family adhesin SdrC [Lachnospiraceae bacterium]
SVCRECGSEAESTENAGPAGWETVAGLSADEEETDTDEGEARMSGDEVRLEGNGAETASGTDIDEAGAVKGDGSDDAETETDSAGGEASVETTDQEAETEDDSENTDESAAQADSQPGTLNISDMDTSSIAEAFSNGDVDLSDYLGVDVSAMTGFFGGGDDSAETETENPDGGDASAEAGADSSDYQSDEDVETESGADGSESQADAAEDSENSEDEGESVSSESTEEDWSSGRGNRSGSGQMGGGMDMSSMAEAFTSGDVDLSSIAEAFTSGDIDMGSVADAFTSGDTSDLTSLLTGEEEEDESVTVYLPVGVIVYTTTGKEKTFTILQAGDELEVLFETDTDGNEVITKMWLKDTQ